MLNLKKRHQITAAFYVENLKNVKTSKTNNPVIFQQRHKSCSLLIQN